MHNKKHCFIKTDFKKSLKNHRAGEKSQKSKFSRFKILKIKYLQIIQIIKTMVYNFYNLKDKITLFPKIKYFRSNCPLAIIKKQIFKKNLMK